MLIHMQARLRSHVQAQREIMSQPYREEHPGGDLGACGILLEIDLRAIERLDALQGMK